MHEWHSAVVGACGTMLSPRERGRLPVTRRPRLGVSRVPIIGSGKDVGLTTGWDGSGAPLGTASIQRVGSDEDSLSTREVGGFPKFGAV